MITYSDIVTTMDYITENAFKYCSLPRDSMVGIKNVYTQRTEMFCYESIKWMKCQRMAYHVRYCDKYTF